MYIIIKGMVKEIDASGEILALYHPSDSFDTQALFEQSYRHSFIAVEQSLRYAQNHHPYAHRRKQRI
ncbi:cyclic nucleotide-binding domain-containing protein [Moraxella catarrhalis]|nr:cyclic nucleotide-binding domain-containing protein [Moraxella catarrhalis]